MIGKTKMSDYQISTTRKKNDDSRASEINLFIEDISMSSKVDTFHFVVVSLKVPTFPCPSVTNFPFL